MRLKRDLVPSGGVPALADVAAAVDAVCPAIEIIDDRNANYGALDALSLIADNAWNAGIVLGEFVHDWPDLASIEGIVSVDGKPSIAAWGATCSATRFIRWHGSPHISLEQGSGLHAGDIVMTGSVVTTKFPDRPLAYRFDVTGLGASTPIDATRNF